ncbi:DUF502 domain-containing protein [Dethiobacter alkaliphilus]|uniref:DUF502 domain-containing protein n=1 Tax=Dethiobacter alkaliphilus TaxID=427926 RepID=UPI002227B68C|nr:DUF502 domain-containing protein [Dethiobacter alkaliphilus]MCW3490708.1 DUF502 domain-containing protein [Dethiobacter alkaliphilus]
MNRIRRIFIAGLLFLLPTLITLYLLIFLFTSVDSIFNNLFSHFFDQTLPGLGFLLTIAFIFGVGLLATNVLGAKIISQIEKTFAGLPVVKPVYAAIRQIIDAFSGDRKNIFESVAMVEYPRKGMYAIGFITGKGAGEVQEKTAQDVQAVFIPTTPNPTSGFLLLIPKEQLMPLEMTVEEALKLIISGGVVVPDWPRPQ